MIQVGLTGGIGAGKSTVARLLAARGAHVVDADRLAREAVAPGSPGLAEVVVAFGPAVLAPDGTLDRARLAATVFADPQARRRLDAIVHPRVGAATARLLASLPPDAVVVHDVPLLVENDLADRYDLVVVVDAPVEVQEARLVGQRGMTPADARARIAAQASREQRRRVADVVLDNTGSLADLAGQVDRLWQRIERLRTGG
ncbi:MAG: dephospho-CoA kinase [Actinomycetota bacterium]